ncbi:MAG: O-antigen ligase family protein [Pseudomonadota bacterium]
MIGRGVSYAAYFAGWFLLWPIVSYAGGQGYTGLVGFLALPVLLFARPKGVPLYAALFIAFIGWALVTTLWSPAGGPLISGSVSGGTFGVSSAGLRIGLTALAGVAVLLACSQLQSGTAPRALKTVSLIALVHGIGVIVTAAFMPQVLTLFAPLSDPVREMPQNLSRNANAFVLMLPLVLICFWREGQRARQIGLALFVLLTAWALLATGSDAGFAALLASMLAIALVWALKQRGLSALFALAGGYMILAPVIVPVIASFARTSGLALSNSSWSRLYAWDVTLAKIKMMPLFGHGLEASQTWQERFRDHPELLAEIMEKTGGTWSAKNFPIVPSHPHNMPLQVWAETGFVGAALFAGVLWALAWRFRDGWGGNAPTHLAAAGLLAGVTVFASLSYNMWNEAFWASVAIAASALLIYSRQTQQ